MAYGEARRPAVMRVGTPLAPNKYHHFVLPLFFTITLTDNRFFLIWEQYSAA